MKILIPVSYEKNARQDNTDALRCANSIGRALTSKKMTSEILFIKPADFVNPKQKIIKRINQAKADCIFNLFEGFNDAPQREADFAAILEKTRIPFTGNTSIVLNRCLDKNECKSILLRSGLPVPPGYCIKKSKDMNSCKIDLPVFIKPCCEDASVGVDRDSLVCEKKELDKTVKSKLKTYPRGLIIEEFLPGKEFNVSFFGEPPYEMIGISAIDYNKLDAGKPFMSYEAKWDKSNPDFNRLVPEVIKKNRYGKREKEVIALSRKAAKLIGCKGYFRVDLRMKGKKVYIIDINPNPDINTDSGFIRQAYAAGYSYEEIICKNIFFAKKNRW